MKSNYIQKKIKIVIVEIYVHILNYYICDEFSAVIIKASKMKEKEVTSWFNCPHTHTQFLCAATAGNKTDTF